MCYAKDFLANGIPYQEFRNLYGINKDNFKAFIKYKKLDDPTSCAAIRKWLSEKK